MFCVVVVFLRRGRRTRRRWCLKRASVLAAVGTEYHSYVWYRVCQKGLSPSPCKKCEAGPIVWGDGEESLLFDPGSELRLRLGGGREEKQGRRE